MIRQTIEPQECYQCHKPQHRYIICPICERVHCFEHSTYVEGEGGYVCNDCYDIHLGFSED